MKSRQNGNTLSEYGIAGAVILGATLLAIAFLGGNISDLLGKSNQAANVDIVPGLLSSAGGNGNATNTPTQPATPPSKPPYDPPPSDANGMAEVEIKFSGGGVLSMNYPVDPAKSVQTVGANGTTGTLAKTLMALAQKLLDEGKITEDQFQYFQKLANDGHRIAGMQGNLERILTDNSSIATGQGALTGLDYQNYQRNYGESMNSANGLPALQEDYQALLNSGALNDPAVKSIVTNLYENIVAINTSFESSIGEFASPTKVTYVVYPEDFKGNLNEQSHQNAVGICNVGGGQDTGVHCP